MMTLIQEKQLKKTLATAYYSHEKGLNARAFFKLHSHQISEDLVQNTFKKTWIFLARGGRVVVMKAFLYHILNQLIVDEYRKHTTVSLDALLEKGFEPSFDDAEHIANVLDGSAAMLLILRLPEKYQNVMRMRYEQELSLKEISKITGIAKNTLASQTYRGLKKLRLLYNHA